jgi:segregation and condensation protein B
LKLNDELAIVEAILFASGEPIEAERLAASAGLEVATLVNVIDMLKDKYEGDSSALCVLKLGNSYQLATKSKFESYIRTALESRKSTPLSPAAMEVLTIIAYNQPVTKGFVEHVRGVDSSSVVNSLVEKRFA